MDYFSNISYAISHVFLMLFIYLFIIHRYSKPITILICFFAFFSLVFLDCFKLDIFSDSDLCYFIVTIIQITITQSVNIIISQKRDNRTLFMGLSASNYVIAGSITASILYICTANKLFSLAGSTIVHFSILVILFFKIRTICLRFQEREYMKNWWELCLVPVFFYCGFSFLAFFPYTLYDNPANIPGVIIFIITMFVSYVVVMRYMGSQSENIDIYWKNVFMEEYIKGLENQYRLVEQSEHNLKILRHDMRHYSRMIDSLLEQKKYDEIKKITEYINDVMDENKIVKYCNNLIANTIISKMMEKASFLGIEVKMDIIIPNKIPVNEYEFTSVIANLFENALICVKEFKNKKKSIYVKIHCNKEYLLMQMKNEYDKEIILDEVTGFPKSTKGGNHGLGMQSVLAFAEKIGGETGCYLDNGIFNIMIFAKF